MSWCIWKSKSTITSYYWKHISNFPFHLCLNDFGHHFGIFRSHVEFAICWRKQAFIPDSHRKKPRVSFCLVDMVVVTIFRFHENCFEFLHRCNYFAPFRKGIYIYIYNERKRETERDWERYNQSINHKCNFPLPLQPLSSDLSSRSSVFAVSSKWVRRWWS